MELFDLSCNKLEKKVLRKPFKVPVFLQSYNIPLLKYPQVEQTVSRSEGSNWDAFKGESAKPCQYYRGH